MELVTTAVTGTVVATEVVEAAVLTTCVGIAVLTEATEEKAAVEEADVSGTLLVLTTEGIG